MSKLEFRILTSDAAIDHFLECFKKFVKVKLPEEYARSGDVIGVFKQNEMIGGYMIITRGPFRALAFVPDEVKKNFRNLRLAGQTDFVEVNGFWVDERYRGSRESLQMWFQIRKSVLDSKASHLLLFYNSQAKGLAHIYEAALNPQLIYQGPPVINSFATTSHSEVKVSLVSRLDVRLGIYRGLGLIINRRIQSRAA